MGSVRRGAGSLSEPIAASRNRADEARRPRIRDRDDECRRQTRPRRLGQRASQECALVAIDPARTAGRSVLTALSRTGRSSRERSDRRPRARRGLAWHPEVGHVERLDRAPFRDERRPTPGRDEAPLNGRSRMSSAPAREGAVALVTRCREHRHEHRVPIRRTGNHPRAAPCERGERTIGSRSSSRWSAASDTCRRTRRRFRRHNLRPPARCPARSPGS